MGCQPVRCRTEPESSSEDRKSCEMNGLYSTPEVLVSPAVGTADGLAQASQLSRATSVIAPAIRNVISVAAIATSGFGILERQLWPKSLEDHLIGPAAGALPVAIGSHGPGQQRKTENISRRERYCAGQILHRIGEELQPRAQRLRNVGDGTLSANPERFPLIASMPLRNEAARQSRCDRTQVRDLCWVKR